VENPQKAVNNQLNDTIASFKEKKTEKNFLRQDI
jgi:hypothetical protein